MRTANLCATALLVGLLLPVGSAFGQHNWQRTITVDPQLGAADHQTIQLGINDVKIGMNPTVRFTVLIFAGTYTENVILNEQKENVDLVGIDRYSVIIAPTSAGSGIKITSGTETSRNNRIANLTIITDDGHGIEIVKGIGGSDKTPKDIQIEGVTIQAVGTGQDGIYASEVDTLRIADVDITTTNGHGIEFVKPGAAGGQAPKDIEIEGVTILAVGTLKHGIEGGPADTVRIFNCNIDSAGGHGVVVGDNYQIISSLLRSSAAKDALKALDKDGLLVSNCTLDSQLKGFSITTSSNIEVLGTTIRGVREGVSLYSPGENVRFLGCTIVGEGNIVDDVYGVYGDFDDSNTKIDPIFQSCWIEAQGGQNTLFEVALQIDNTEGMQFIDCDFRATSLDNSQAKPVYGIRCAGGPVFVVGGSIETSQPNFAKAIDVFDLVGDEPGSTPDRIFISGTRFSKWIGPINAAGRPRSVIQRTIDAGVADDDLILEAEPLTGSEQPNVSPDSQPDVYRVLSVTGNETDMNQFVYIIGTDWADNLIAEEITLTGIMLAKGKKPFKTVTKIILPAQNDPDETVKVGITNKLGLYYPIALTSDVLQQGSKASGASSYTLEAIGTPDVVYSTVDVTATITAGDSFEWALLTGR